MQEEICNVCGKPFLKDEEGNWFHIKDCKFLEDGSIVYPEK